VAEDDDTIYVDIAPRLDEDAAESESRKLRDRFKRSAKVPVEPELDEESAQKTRRHLSDIFHHSSKIKIKPDVDDRELDNVSKKLSGTIGGSLDKIFDGKNLFSDLRKQLTGVLNLGDVLGGQINIGGLDLGAAVGDSLSNSIGQALKAAKLPTNFEEGIGTLESALEKLGPAAAAAAGPLAALAGVAAFAAMDFKHFLDSTDPRNGFIRPPGQDPIQTPGGQMALPGQLQPAKLPPGAPPGTQYQESQGDINDPFSGLLPPGGLSGLPIPKDSKAPRPTQSPGTLTPRGFVPAPPGVNVPNNIAPPDFGGAAYDKPSAAGGGVPIVQTAGGKWTSPDPAWAHLINRESGGNPSIIQGIIDANSGGNEAQGLFQITPATWRSHGGSKYGPNPGQASPSQQAEIAANIFRANPSGSDWGAGLSGRESASALSAGLGRGGAQAQLSGFFSAPPPAVGGGGIGGALGPAPAPGGGASNPGIPALGQAFLPPDFSNSGGGLSPQGLAPPGRGQPQQPQRIGEGKGFGISGGLIGAAEQAGAMAAGVGSFGAGGQLAAQIAEQQINLAIEKGTQAANIAAEAPFETFWASGGQMGAESIGNFPWVTKIMGGLSGAGTAIPNVAGATQKPKDPNEQNQQQGPGKDGQQMQGQGQQQGQGQGAQRQPPTGHEDDPIHVKSADPGGSPNPAQGDATSSMSTTSPAMSVMTA
jgi:hypothetical protein